MKKQLAKEKRGVFNTGASGCGGGSGEVRAAPLLARAHLAAVERRARHCVLKR
jgi:hypothetical protein